MRPVGPRRYQLGALALVAVLLVVGALVLLNQGGTKRGTAYFDQTVNLYPDDEIRVLGVPVGTITAIAPAGDQVRVDFEYDDEVTIPANATAAIISPSLVGIRFIQLGPGYTGGPEMPDGAVIPIARTASPAEWDRIKREVQDLAAALGPQAQASSGALTRLLDTTDANLGGQGPAIRRTVTDLSRAVSTLSDGRQDLFATIRNLGVLIRAIKDADAQVARFQTQLARVSGVLAENRSNLATALDTVTTKLPVVERFIRDNRSQLVTDVEKLRDVTSNLAANRQGLADVLQRGPVAISNFANIIDENSGSVTAALAATNFRDPAAFFCDAAASAAPGGASDPAAANACRAGLGALLNVARLDVPPITVNPIVSGDAPGQGGNR